MAGLVLCDAVVACLDETHTRLSLAAQTAKAARASARAGSLAEAVTISYLRKPGACMKPLRC